MPISLEGCLRSYQLLELSKFMGWTGLLAEQGRTIFSALAKAFIECDASLIEINPLIETKNGELLALDAKISIDDDALFRQPELFAFHDPSQLNPFEARAKEYDLAYVAMEGDIGCMVNGAGLAMATMDIIHHYGGTPANFLDVGGGASEDKVAEGFKIILSDSRVKAILVNIFGGIMNCITLAAGIIAAAKEFGIRVPLVVRMEGTNVEQGKKMLGESDLPIIIAKDLADAASKVVEAAKKGP
jgi:succinyl-CoA synthetase beta subunit